MQVCTENKAPRHRTGPWGISRCSTATSGAELDNHRGGLGRVYQSLEENLPEQLPQHITANRPKRQEQLRYAEEQKAGGKDEREREEGEETGRTKT